MFRFANIDVLYAYSVFPFLILVFIIMSYQKKKALKRFGDLMIINRLMPDASFGRSVLKLIIILFAMNFLILAIANPQIGSKTEEVKRSGVDMIIALDVSNSMMAEDISPNRLERSRQAIAKLIERLHGDRIGLIVFAGQAYVQLPITTDYAAAKLFLMTVGTDIVPAQGTAIGEAIELSITSLGDTEEKAAGINANTKNKTIIVITDGENHEEGAIEAARKAAELGIIVNTIGMGLPKGGPIPVYQNGRQAGFRKDKDGKTIVTKLNENMLQQIASAGNGSYIRANNVQTGLDVLFEQINKMEKVELGSKIFTDYEDRFQYFLAPAILLIVLELLISERKSRWLRKLNLFKNE